MVDMGVGVVVVEVVVKVGLVGVGTNVLIGVNAKVVGSIIVKAMVEMVVVEIAVIR